MQDLMKNAGHAEWAGSSKVSYTSHGGDLVLVRRAYIRTCCPGKSECWEGVYDEDGLIDDEWDHEPTYEWEAVEVIHVTGSDEQRRAALGIFYRPDPLPSPNPPASIPTLSALLAAAGIPIREAVAA